MKKLAMILPAVAMLGLVFSGSAMAKPQSAQDMCDYGYGSEVCILNLSGQQIYPEVDLPSMEITPMSSLTIYHSAYGIDPILVKITNAEGQLIFDQDWPNHGQVIEIDPDLHSKTKVKVRVL